MDFAMDIVNAYAPQIIGAILTALAGVVGLAIKNLATKYINTNVKREIARTVVQAVEQIYRHLDGPAKLEKALEAAAGMLTENGIRVTDLELRMLLEAAVGEFNDVFNTAVILPGIDAEMLTDDQLRAALQQMGYAYTDDMTREQLLAALDEADETALA